MTHPTIDNHALNEGQAAADDLATALGLAGIKLPSLQGDFPAAGHKPHVQLGGASAETVRLLAEWIRVRAAEHATEPD
ncbi:hypothetical protein [Streptomyces sp. CBMA29]|uniref:hypothetical protein n=1 Tax=Streptomyces sp. CBMA29 TaxID=1896314 RepID=UPI001661F6AD|nr:hypothetical protein [Streptomyces sp. CBMA29]MBD0739323.1 hypothetical protein [Streptomyces sp. CBMA29]